LPILNPSAFIKQDNITIGLSEHLWSELATRTLPWIQDFHVHEPDSPGPTVEEVVRAERDPKARLLRGRALRDLLDKGTLISFGQIVHLPGREVSLPVKEDVLWEELRLSLRSQHSIRPGNALG